MLVLKLSHLPRWKVQTIPRNLTKSPHLVCGSRNRLNNSAANLIVTRFESFSASPLFDDTSYKPSDRSEGRANNELGSEGTTWTTSKRFDDDPNATSTTSSSSYIENASSITSTRFPTIFTCSRYFNVNVKVINRSGR